MKDRKNLFLILCLVIIGVFTLTIAYSALSTVLTIQGNARVAAANWDIYLDNARVTSGSATTNKPVIKTSSTLEFSTTLNMPGDYYEFVVDVVNDGDLDAMIGNVVKTPELSASQAKYLKYEVSYQNGESISKKQVLSKGAKMPIKVRIEYRKDLGNSDLPTSQVVLDLSLTLEYIQSDGSGSSVTNNGQIRPVANGNIEDIGTIVTIGSEQFYTIGTEGDNVKLLAMYNLYVGGDGISSNPTTYVLYGDEATGMQNSDMKGLVESGFPYRGVTRYGPSDDYEDSKVKGYVDNYKVLLESNFDIIINNARLISHDELVDPNTFSCQSMGVFSCKNSPYPWIYSTSYWTGSKNSYEIVYAVMSDMRFIGDYIDYDIFSGVRPVIVISKDYF